MTTVAPYQPDACAIISDAISAGKDTSSSGVARSTFVPTRIIFFHYSSPARRDLLPAMPMHGAQPPTLQLSFQWSLSSREAENDNPTAHFALAHTSRCMYCARVHGFLLSCFLFCEVSFLPETPFVYLSTGLASVACTSRSASSKSASLLS